VQTILVGASVNHGLGRYFDTLSDGSIAAYHKVGLPEFPDAQHRSEELTPLQFSYSGSILAIVSMALTKFSVLQLQRRLCGLQPASRYIKVMHRALAVAIVIWTIFSVFALAFQCGTVSPQIYEPDRCANGALWYPVTIVNAVTDAALAFSFSPIIMALSARTQTKVKVIVLLGARLL
jgi:hypothetical protein